MDALAKRVSSEWWPLMTQSFSDDAKGDVTGAQPNYCFETLGLTGRGSLQ